MASCAAPFHCPVTNPVQETLKCSVNLLDVLGLYVVLTRLLGRSEMKVMITAVGNTLNAAHTMFPLIGGT